MKVFLAFNIFLLLSSNIFSIEVKTNFTEQFEKEILLQCSEDEIFCNEICQKNNCIIKEKICRNCIGNTLELSYIFTQMGKAFTSGEEVAIETFLETILTEDFVSLDSKSIYNNIFRYNNFRLQTSFRSLCPEYVETPVVFFSTNEIGEIFQSKFVVCQNKVFSLNHKSDVSFGEN